jgi:hypothetical protein
MNLGHLVFNYSITNLPNVSRLAVDYQIFSFITTVTDHPIHVVRGRQAHP